MRGEIDNFTRGSQLLSHKFLMFKSGFGLLMLLHLGLTALTAILFVVYNSTEHERYLAMMRGEALGWQWMELDPTKAMWIETAGGGKITLTWAQAVTHPVLQRGWQAVMDPLWSGIVYGSFAGVILVAIGWYVSKRIGLSARQDKEQRGAHLTSRKLLIKELKAHNLVQFSASLKTALKAGNSWLWWLQFPFVTRRDWQKAGEYWPHSLADVPFPWGTETFHTMACGTTGSGKTTLIMDLIAQARNKQQRAVIFDLTGGFIGPFYDPARDIILNPQDARCPTWSVFNDADDKNGFRQMAHAIVPHDGGTSEPFWVEAARTLFVEACLKLQEAGHRTNASLGHELMTVPLAQVEALLANTIAAPFTSTDAARMAESVRSTLNINAEALLSLPTDGRPFSIRKWIEEDGADGFLFLATRPNEMETNRRLITVWMNLAIQGMMSGRKKRTIDTWFIFDEVGALHRLPALEAGLQTSRNFGGAFILGVHAYDKIADVYGDKMATVISSLTRTKVILSTADRKTAEWCSDFIGKQQYREMEEGVSYGYSTMRDAVTLTARLRTEPLVLPDTITNLPSLHGYIKFPEGFPAAPIKLQYVKRIDHAEPFMHRDSRPGAPGTDLPFEGQNRPGEGSRTTQPHAGPTGQTRKSKETGKKKSAGVLGLFEGRQEPVFETDAGDEARPKSDHDVDPETGQLGRAIARTTNADAPSPTIQSTAPDETGSGETGESSDPAGAPPSDDAGGQQLTGPQEPGKAGPKSKQYRGATHAPETPIETTPVTAATRASDLPLLTAGLLQRGKAPSQSEVAGKPLSETAKASSGNTPARQRHGARMQSMGQTVLERDADNAPINEEKTLGVAPDLLADISSGGREPSLSDHGIGDD
jgi:type IV conjugative transfer system coupling protein TraD